MAVKRDQLRKFISWSREAYCVACDPPATNYSKRVDAVERDDINAYSRAYLLRLSIDVKYIVSCLLANLPKKRAEVLHAWIKDDSEYAESRLTYRQRANLKRDREILAERLRSGLEK